MSRARDLARAVVLLGTQGHSGPAELARSCSLVVHVVLRLSSRYVRSLSTSRFREAQGLAEA